MSYPTTVADLLKAGADGPTRTIDVVLALVRQRARVAGLYPQS